MRNAGHRHFYKRGKIFYRVQGGVWTSLGTDDRRDALKRLHEIEAQVTVTKVLEKLGIKAQLDRLETAISSGKTPNERSDPLAPNSAKAERGEFAQELEKFLSRLPTASESTRRMYKTARNDLLRTIASEISTNGDVAGLSAWEFPLSHGGNFVSSVGRPAVMTTMCASRGRLSIAAGHEITVDT